MRSDNRMVVRAKIRLTLLAALLSTLVLMPASARADIVTSGDCEAQLVAEPGEDTAVLTIVCTSSDIPVAPNALEFSLSEDAVVTPFQGAEPPEGFVCVPPGGPAGTTVNCGGELGAGVPAFSNLETMDPCGNRLRVRDLVIRTSDGARSFADVVVQCGGGGGGGPGGGGGGGGAPDGGEDAGGESFDEGGAADNGRFPEGGVDSGSGGGATRTGEADITPLIGAAALLVLAGAGAVFARRRSLS